MHCKKKNKEYRKNCKTWFKVTSKEQNIGLNTNSYVWYATTFIFFPGITLTELVTTSLLRCSRVWTMNEWFDPKELYAFHSTWPRELSSREEQRTQRREGRIEEALFHAKTESNKVFWPRIKDPKQLRNGAHETWVEKRILICYVHACVALRPPRCALNSNECILLCMYPCLIRSAPKSGGRSVSHFGSRNIFSALGCRGVEFYAKTDLFGQVCQRLE